MNLWNIKDLKLPVTSTCKIDDRNIDLHLYITTCTETKEIFQNQPHLEAEAALLSRCIYRMKMKFRNDNGLKSMEKVNSALRRYLSMDVPKLIDNFLQLLPKERGKEAYYPTQSNLDYILIRLQGTAKLMSRVAECARSSALFMKNRISIGHVWKIALIALALVSRIYILSKNLVKACCTLYNNLFGLRCFLKSNSDYLTKDYIFPEKLETWLDMDCLFEDVVIGDLPVDINKKLLRFCSNDDSDVEYSGEYVEIDDDIELVNEYIDITHNKEKSETETLDCSIINHDDKINERNDENNQIREDKKHIGAEEDIGEAILPKAVDTKKLTKEETRKLKYLQKVNKNEKFLHDIQNKRKINNKNTNDEDFGTKIKSCQTLNGKVGKQKSIMSISENSNIAGASVKKQKIGKLIHITDATENKQEIRTSKNIASLTKSGLEVKKQKNITKQTSDIMETRQKNITDVKKQKSKMQTVKSTIESFSSMDDLKGFLKRENKMRSGNEKKCKLKNLNKMQWNMLSNLVKNLISKAKKDEGKSVLFLKKGKEALLMNIC